MVFWAPRVLFLIVGVGRAEATGVSGLLEEVLEAVLRLELVDVANVDWSILEVAFSSESLEAVEIVPAVVVEVSVEVTSWGVVEVADVLSGLTVVVAGGMKSTA